GLEVLHRPNNLPVAEDGISFDVDMADLHLGTFIDLESEFQRRRRNAANLGFDFGVLMAPLGEEFEQYVLRPLDLVRVVLGFDDEPDLALLVAIQNLGNGHRLVAFVLDGADHRPLDHDETDDPADFSGFALDADVVEAAGVPQRHEIAV